MNWGTIRDLAQVKLQDSGNKIWTDAQLLKWANESLSDLIIGSEGNTKYFRFEGESGTRAYDLPEDLYEIRSVRVNGRKIFGKTSEELEDLDRTYLVALGRPDWYYLDGINQIAFHKIPSWTDSKTTFDSELGVLVNVDDDFEVSSEFGVTTEILDDSGSERYLVHPLEGAVIDWDSEPYVIDIFYSYKPASMSLDTDTPDLPGYMHYAVLYGCLKEAFARDGQGQDENAAEFYTQRYKELEKEFFGRSREFDRGQDQMISMQPPSWGSDQDWRIRVFP